MLDPLVPAPGDVLESSEAVRRIARALPPVERIYATIRFAIFRQRFLTMLDMALPDRGRILDVGSGFGLFSCYMALMSPHRQILGIDPNQRRCRIARAVAQTVGATQNTYEAGTVQTVNPQGPFQGIFMLDVLHHVPRDDQLDLLGRLRALMSPRSVLVLKDVTTDEPFKLAFTWALDRLMVGLREPLGYRHHTEWATHLRNLDLDVRIHRVPDILPYPHVILIGRPTADR